MTTAPDAHTARAIAGSLNRPLTAGQKRALIAGARMAYDRAGRGTGLTFEEWRREQQEQACGLASLRLCTQRHYKLIQGHWDLLNGRKVDALRKFVGAAGGEQERELALAKLTHECRRLSQPVCEASPFASPAAARWYCEGFLQNKRKATLETATADDIWHAFYTLRRKVAGSSRRTWQGQGDDKGTGRRGDKEPDQAPLSAGHPVSAASAQGSPETRQDSIPEGGGPAAAGRGRISARPATRNPQTTANDPRATP